MKKFRRTKLPKFRIGAENFLRRKFCSPKFCPIRYNNDNNTILSFILVHQGYRGGLTIDLISPNGTISPILKRRPNDNSQAGFNDWKFLTVFHWDEQAIGKMFYYTLL